MPQLQGGYFVFYLLFITIQLSKMSDIKFDELPESKEMLSIKTAGVHLKLVLDSFEFVDAKETPASEDGKKPAKKTNAYVKFVFKNETHQMVHFMFTPPTKEEEVKYVKDKYEKGIKIRKYTPTEMIKLEFDDRFYFYEQLARAWNASKEKLDSLKKISGTTDTMFKVMFDKFFSVFPKEWHEKKYINLKTTFSNNAKTKRSFLALCKAEQSNMIFAPYINDNVPGLQLNDWEEQNSVRKFKPQDQAPGTDNADAGAANAEDSDWQPATKEEKDAPDLF
jgi:hypothetical protein